MTDDIIFTRKEHIGCITLNRAKALHALTLPMILALQEQMHAWRDDHNIHAVVVKAAPGKAFCAGGDVRWIYDMGQRHNSQQREFFWHEYRLNHFIHQFNKPYIALMDGITMGGGVGISLHGSHPVATERFVFAMPETSIGFFPDIGASHLLSRCPGQFGVYLGLTGNRLGAADAEALGLVKHVIPSDKLDGVLDMLCEEDLSTNAAARVSATLQRITTPISEAPILLLQNAIDHCFYYDEINAILDALAETEGVWANSTHELLLQKAPFSLAVTLAQIRKAKILNLADCLKMDYRLVLNFMKGGDFYEGVRALLIDKDKSPHWQPQTIAQVDAAQVEQYFEGEALSLIDY